MKKLLLLTAIVAGLTACSSNSAPTDRPIASDLQDVPILSQDEVLSLTTFAVPKSGQVVVQEGAFQTEDNVYKSNGYDVLIPRRAVLEVLYTNDGVNCTIQWKKMYPDVVEYRKQRNSLKVVDLQATSRCSPKRGIVTDDRMIVNFDPSYQ